MWQDNQQYSSQNYYTPNPAAPLQFYQPSSTVDSSGFYPGSRPSLEGHVAAQGNISQGGAAAAYGGSIQSQGPWWTAFGTGGFDGEPPLMEELGINFSHIRAKSLTVLNPFRRIDEHIMDDADLAGPLLFCFCFATFLLLSGKSQFGYIYGVGLLGSVSIYTLLNLMSEVPIDAYRVTSVLGYCLLPMVGVGAVSMAVSLDTIMLGHLLALLSVVWCTYSASGIFVVVLRMSEQRLLVAYPVGLLYGCFALLTLFSSSSKSV